MINIRFNTQQKKELSKALFNSGNLVFASLILSQIVSDKLDPSMFLIGIFAMAILFASAIMLLSMNKERGAA